MQQEPQLDERLNEQPKGNAVYPDVEDIRIKPLHKELDAKGRDGDPFLQTGTIIVLVILAAIAVIIFTTKFL